MKKATVNMLWGWAAPQRQGAARQGATRRWVARQDYDGKGRHSGTMTARGLFPHKGNKDWKVVALGMQRAWVNGGNSIRRWLLHGRRWGGIKDGKGWRTDNGDSGCT
jgi:hypothetical protein